MALCRFAGSAFPAGGRGPGPQAGAVLCCVSSSAGRGATAGRGCAVCAHLSTSFVLRTARADPVAEQRWRAVSELSLSTLGKALADRAGRAAFLRGWACRESQKSPKCSRSSAGDNRVPPCSAPTRSPGTSGATSAAAMQNTACLSVDHNHCPNSELFLFALLSYYLPWAPPEEDIATAVISNTPTEVSEEKGFICHFWLSGTKRQVPHFGGVTAQ